MERDGLEPRDDPAELLGGFAGDGEPARGQAHAGGRILLLERLHGRVEHLAQRGDVLHGPVVELLGDPPPLGPLREQPLGEEVVVAQGPVRKVVTVDSACEPL